ncbi:MAG: class I SAM-dependent methyltransferase [Planctomycetaceae bacterium]|nr:class I SAM-dependent methyltransferase [Planctomycetaceae bacterium]
MTEKAESENIEDDQNSADEAPQGPFHVPGGWCRESLECGEELFTLTHPAQPDLLLDDPNVLSENESTVYIPYWALLWPAARRMVEMFQFGQWTPGASCLEIGCGIGLVGLGALRQGLHVTFSDYRKEAVALSCWNAEKAGYQSGKDFKGLQLDWNDPPTDQKFDHIFGCEVVYETDFHKPILAAMNQLLAPGGSCWFGDSGRMNSEKFLSLAISTGWKIERLDRELKPLTEPQIGRFQVFCLQRESSPVT